MGIFPTRVLRVRWGCPVSHLFEVVVASSDSEHSQILATILGHCGLLPVLCSSLREAQSLMGGESIRLVLCADRLADGSFRDIVRPVSRLGLPLVVFRAATIRNSVQRPFNWALLTALSHPFTIDRSRGSCITPYSRCRPELAPWAHSTPRKSLRSGQVQLERQWQRLGFRNWCEACPSCSICRLSEPENSGVLYPPAAARR